MRPTRQRVPLAEPLFAEEHRHVTVDDLHRQAIDAGVSLSLATVYNGLNQFAEAGLAREMMEEAREMVTKSNSLPTIELAGSIHAEPLESTELKPIGSAKLYSRE